MESGAADLPVVKIIELSKGSDGSDDLLEISAGDCRNRKLTVRVVQLGEMRNRTCDVIGKLEFTDGCTMIFVNLSSSMRTMKKSET